MSKTETDILIIGGGIAGCIAAISLSKFYSVTLIDKMTKPKERIGESLAPAAQRILKQLDLLEGMDAKENAIYLNNMGMQSYWGSEQVQVNDHLRNPDGFSRSLDRKAFEVYLRASAEKRGVNCNWSCKLLRSNYENNKWNITTSADDKEQNYTAKFVIDASGRQSHFARSIGIKRQAIDQLMACWVTLPNQNENTMSTIAASKNGWWYSAVIPGNKRVVAFQTDSDLVDRSAFKSIDSFIQLANENAVISKLLEQDKSKTTLQGTVAANSTQLDQVTGQQWAAIGDAAVSFDPLSSQGMFNAMASAMQLSELITESDGINNLNEINLNRINITYQQQMNSVWTHYLKHKNLFYNMEKRWKDSEFWKRRA